LIYYLKNWYGTSFTHFLDLPDNKLNIRTNNIAEGFNLKLNRIIDHIHPKMSYFCEKYKIIITEYYNLYINYMKNINEDKIKEAGFIAKDIYNFTLKLIEKYKSPLGYKIIAQMEVEEEIELKSFLFKMFDILFEIKEDEDLEGDEDDKEDIIEYEHLEDDNDSLNGEYNNDCFEINNIKIKLNDMARDYYKKNYNSIYNDINLDKVPNKRKNEDFINIYLKKVEAILNIDKKTLAKEKKKK
jgi:hypothetical protein